MKSLLFKLIPGAGVTIAALLIGSVWSRGQVQTVKPSVQGPAPELAPQAQPPIAQPATLTICGSCGTRILAPQVVMVAAPADGWQQPNYREPQGVEYVQASYYEPIRPLPLFPDWDRPVREIRSYDPYFGSPSLRPIYPHNRSHGFDLRHAPQHGPQHRRDPRH